MKLLKLNFKKFAVHYLFILLLLLFNSNNTKHVKPSSFLSTDEDDVSAFGIYDDPAEDSFPKSTDYSENPIKSNKSESVINLSTIQETKPLINLKAKEELETNNNNNNINKVQPLTKDVSLNLDEIDKQLEQSMVKQDKQIKEKIINIEKKTNNNLAKNTNNNNNNLTSNLKDSLAKEIKADNKIKKEPLILPLKSNASSIKQEHTEIKANKDILAGTNNTSIKIVDNNIKDITTNKNTTKEKEVTVDKNSLTKNNFQASSLIKDTLPKYNNNKNKNDNNSNNIHSQKPIIINTISDNGKQAENDHKLNNNFSNKSHSILESDKLLNKLTENKFIKEIIDNQNK